MAKKVSISDIAKSLGVSKTLVSLVINNKGDKHGISLETQSKVLEKIEELNYKPNTLARGFRTGKTNTIGLIVSDISNRFYSRIARKIEDKAWEIGYSVVICSTDENIEKENKQINLLIDRQIDGLIISSSQQHPEVFKQMQKSDFPHVLIDRTFKGINSDTVSVDNYGGGQLAARHLISQGVEKFGILSISPEHISTLKERENGFCETLKSANIEISKDCFLRIPFNNMEESLKKQLLKLYQTGKMPEAFFCLNNNLTSTCLQTLKSLNIKVPGDILLIGFDDMQYYSFTQPSISAITQPIELIGEKAFELLIKQINRTNKEVKENKIVFDTDIIIRESTTKIHKHEKE